MLLPTHPAYPAHSIAYTLLPRLLLFKGKGGRPSLPLYSSLTFNQASTIIKATSPSSRSS